MDIHEAKQTVHVENLSGALAALRVIKLGMDGLKLSFVYPHDVPEEGKEGVVAVYRKGIGVDAALREVFHEEVVNVEWPVGGREPLAMTTRVVTSAEEMMQWVREEKEENLHLCDLPAKLKLGVVSYREGSGEVVLVSLRDFKRDEDARSREAFLALRNALKEKADKMQAERSSQVAALSADLRNQG